MAEATAPMFAPAVSAVLLLKPRDDPKHAAPQLANPTHERRRRFARKPRVASQMLPWVTDPIPRFQPCKG